MCLLGDLIVPCQSDLTEIRYSVVYDPSDFKRLSDNGPAIYFNPVMHNEEPKRFVDVLFLTSSWY